MERPQARQDFSYPKGFLYLRLVLVILLLALLAMTTLLFGIFGVWTALLFIILAVYLIVVGLSPFLTNHWVTLTRLVLRQGLYFKVSIPYAQIEEIRLTDEVAKYGVSASLTKRRVYATTSQQGLVVIKLRRPIRLLLVLGRSANEIVVSVDEPERFLATVQERMELFPPVETDRTHAKLRH